MTLPGYPNHRRGVTLLLVLGLMSMFAMLVVTFMVVTTQARRTSEITAEAILSPKTGAAEAAGGSPATEVGSALLPLLVGGLDHAIGPHGILENLYGHPVAGDDPDLLAGTFNGTTQDRGRLRIPYDKSLFDYADTTTSAAGRHHRIGDLVGSVLTVSSVPDGATDDQQKYAGKSTIIIRFDEAAGFIYAAPFKNVPNDTAADQASTLTDTSGGSTALEYIVNSRPYGGTGPGFDATAAAGSPALGSKDPEGNSVDGDFPLVLRPNALAPDISDGTQPYKEYLEDYLVLMNPDYTAPDYRNLFLAWYGVSHDGTTGVPGIDHIIPSLHRPEIVEYYRSTIDAEDKLRRLTLRPMPFDHPDFSGGNPASMPGGTLTDWIDFLANGPWDVDNDGDGIADGIWVDVGLGTITTGGKTYKRLVSYLVLDMDGRLNVNAHGNILHAFNNSGLDIYGTGATDYGGLERRGTGFGPAEVRFDVGLGAAQSTSGGGSAGKDTDKAQRTLLGTRYSNEPKAGRYGEADLVSENYQLSDADNMPIPGQWYASGAGADYTDTSLDNETVQTLTSTRSIGGILGRMGINPLAYAHYDPDTFWAVGGRYPDWWGMGARAFDPLGNPVFEPLADFENGKHLYRTSPYLMNPYGDTNAADDMAFSAEELQLLLRSVGDLDYANLPTRLRFLLDDQMRNSSDEVEPAAMSDFRFQLTTRSSDIPAFGGVNPSLLALVDNSVGNDSTKAKDLLQLLPEELRRGEKVNLNRPTFHADWQGAAANSPEHRDLLRAKAQFAQEIFYLLLVLCDEPFKNGYSEAGLTNSTTPADVKKAMIARLAQWSVNFVDYLDPDGVMTPFVFSTDPFGASAIYDAGTASDLTAILHSDPAEKGAWTPSRTDLRLIWGFEKPEVAMTETFAVHNRRVADSNKEKPEDGTDECEECKNNEKVSKYRICKTCSDRGGTHDDSFDQVLIPQGSLFIELYRQGDPKRTGYPDPDLVTNPTAAVTGANPEPAKPSLVNLAATVGGVTSGDYVWRIAIGQKSTDLDTIATPPGTEIFAWEEGTDGTDRTYDALYQSENNSNYSFQTLQWDAAGLEGDTNFCDTGIIPDRIIWFGTNAPTGDGTRIPADVADRSYYQFHSYQCGESDLTGNGVALEPNEYLLIAPRMSTSFTSNAVEADTNPFGTAATGSRIELPAAAAASISGNATPGLPTTAKPFKVMIAATDFPALPDSTTAADWWGADHVYLGSDVGAGIGVSVSEPLRGDYYPPPQGTGGSGLKDTYTAGDDGKLPNPLDKQELRSFGTIPCYRTVCLQRLADPLRQHHPVTNPYITVDWSMLDLHVINSEKDSKGAVETELDNANKITAGGGGVYFTSRQWGALGSSEYKADQPNLWMRLISETDNRASAGLKVTPSSSPVSLSSSANMTLGYINAFDAAGTTLSPSDEYQGAPGKGFLHFPWNDAPLSSPFELMQIPAVTAGRFGVEFHDTGDSVTWSGAPSLGSGSGMRFRNPQTDVGPYFNFFQASTTPGNSLDLIRLFELVRIPSPYVGTIRDWYYDDPSGVTDDSKLKLLKPIYSMREPGKINLNTATQAAWAALGGDRWDSTGGGATGKDWPTYEDLKKARGDDVLGGSSVNYPTSFPFPFRSPLAANLVPDLGNTGGEGTLVQTPAAASVLRTFKTETSTGSGDEGGGGESGGSGGTTDLTFNAPDDQASNPNTMFDNVQRLSGATTCRSNVFAVWITVGYFEVTKYEGNSRVADLWDDHSGVASNFPKSSASADENQAFFDAVYPGGYVLGREKGLDDGTVKRHRGFYLIDRTVPVGFRRGQSLNAIDTMIYSKILE